TLVSIRTHVLEKGRNLCRCWRQAGEVKREPANQRPPVHFRSGGKFVLLQAGENKIIQALPWPPFVLNCRTGFRRGRAERPKLALLAPIDLIVTLRRLVVSQQV